MLMQKKVTFEFLGKSAEKGGKKEWLGSMA